LKDKDILRSTKQVLKELSNANHFENSRQGDKKYGLVVIRQKRDLILIIPVNHDHEAILQTNSEDDT